MFSLISYLYHPRAIASATEPSSAVFAAAEIAAYIAVFAVPISVVTFALVIFALVILADAIVPVVVEMFADVIFAVVILAIFAVRTDVTFALLNVELPVTDNVFAKLPEPATVKSSKPIVSNVILPDTVKSPEIAVLP